MKRRNLLALADDIPAGAPGSRKLAKKRLQTSRKNGRRYWAGHAPRKNKGE